MSREPWGRLEASARLAFRAKPMGGLLWLPCPAFQEMQVNIPSPRSGLNPCPACPRHFTTSHNGCKAGFQGSVPSKKHTSQLISDFHGPYLPKCKGKQPTGPLLLAKEHRFSRQRNWGGNRSKIYFRNLNFDMSRRSKVLKPLCSEASFHQKRGRWLCQFK